MASDDALSADEATDGAVEELIGELVLREVTEGTNFSQGGSSAANMDAQEDGEKQCANPNFGTAETGDRSSAELLLVDNKDLEGKTRAPIPSATPGETETGSRGALSDGVPALETEGERLAKQKTKEQEIVTSSEVVARMERIDQRSRLGLREELKSEVEDAGKLEKQEEEEVSQTQRDLI